MKRVTESECCACNRKAQYTVNKVKVCRYHITLLLREQSKFCNNKTVVEIIQS